MKEIEISSYGSVTQDHWLMYSTKKYEGKSKSNGT